MASIKRIRKVEGRISEEIGIALADLASQVAAEDAIVEIGVYKGRSACYLAYGAKQGNGAHVWAIDPWDLPGGEDREPKKLRLRYSHPGTRKAARYNIRAQGFANGISLIRDFSADAAANWSGRLVGMIFIDGDHTYEGVRRDVEAWAPHLSDGAVIAFDDYHNTKTSGVTRAVDDMVSEGTLTPVEVYHDNLAVAKLASEPPSPVESVVTAGAPDEGGHLPPADYSEPREHPGVDWDKAPAFSYSDTVTGQFVEENTPSIEQPVKADPGPLPDEVYGIGDPGPPDLTTMTASELRDYGESLGITMPKGSKTKADLRAKIEKHMSPPIGGE